ncbi:tRNA 2-thiouridine(34) synthase MnmA [Candidatus Falkowbacteria bacterium HGW-Falkowbacteria-1]|uniref:tRNA-specific 2-thiouridylase MnmA n=1 Tax=Candidatus Falkowbacteria bacterium HGW-Falkowbacteria-1 TaxID=2013768 RepID=A0A2N2EA01_9BACT|nr:MAG: tRNA 2-thiouridine(34) synthase MnmA [Candidatus Falkowbacteria bacterium HGW-Falkowbacteria-1]
MEKKKKKVLVAISGGVDSAVSAKLLIDQRYDVSGIFLNFWKEPGTNSVENKCCSLEAQMDAKKVCLDLGVPFYTFNFSSKFKKEVVDNFLNEYQIGRTPNPCVICNKKIKIGGLIDYALSLGFDYLATGHYVGVEKDGKNFKMLKGVDKDKDQSYFLYTLNQKQLKHLIFPLGKWKKPAVRKFAKKSGLLVASKNDSQEICFISGKRHNDFLKKYLKLKPGNIRLWPEGKIISQHQGLPLYTIGQRRGVEIGGTGPYYAAKFDYKNNDLYVVKNFDDPILYGKEMALQDVNWINKNLATSMKKGEPVKTKVVIRYRHKPVSCLLSYNKTNDVYKVKFFKKQRSITPGQSAVFYNGKEVLGGGIIF